MTLLEIGPDFKIMLNKEWLLMIPQFKKLIHRDRGSEGDHDGRKKYKAIRELTYIYHQIDPRSPLENTDMDGERREKALQYAELREKDIDKEVIEALDEYEYLLSISVPTLPLLRASKRTLHKLVEHFENIDFTAKDKLGRQLHSPMDHIKNVSGLSKLHKEIQAFEEVVMSELKQVKQARGKAELSDREQSGKRVNKWSEGEFNPHKNEPSHTSSDRSGLPENAVTDWDTPIQVATLDDRGSDFRKMAQVVASTLEEPEEEVEDDIEREEL